jgi:hypothetical protein
MRNTSKKAAKSSGSCIQLMATDGGVGLLLVILEVMAQPGKSKCVGNRDHGPTCGNIAVCNQRPSNGSTASKKSTAHIIAPKKLKGKILCSDVFFVCITFFSTH